MAQQRLYIKRLNSSDEEGESICSDLDAKDKYCVCGYSSDSDCNAAGCGECKKAKVEISEDNIIHAQLHRAIVKHDCKKIRQLLEDGVKPCTTPKSTNCFILARKSTSILKQLLQIEPSGVNCQDSKGFTMLMLSEKNSTFTLLCDFKPDVNLLNNDGDNILFDLIKRRRYFNSWQLKRYVELGLDVNAVNSEGETALVRAIKECVVAYKLEALFEAGANVPPPYKDGESIVTHAIKGERLGITDKFDFLEVLVKHGVDVSARDNERQNVMYYMIMSHFKLLLELYEYNFKHFEWISQLEETLILLLQNNCQVQGLHMTFQKFIDIEPLHFFSEKLDIIATFARYGASVKFLEQLVNRGLYNWTACIKDHRERFDDFQLLPDAMSPLTAFISRLITHWSNDANFQEILHTCKYLISIGVDPTHRSLDKNFRFNVTRRRTGTHDPRIQAMAEDLIFPDALFFLSQLRTTENFWFHTSKANVTAFEELLRLLLRFWAYPPLFMILIGVELEEYDDESKAINFTNNMFFVRLLIKIGGAVPLGSHYYNSIKTLLHQMVESDVKWQQLLDLILKLDGGIPSLRNLSRAAFRATVKKTCPTGLDFSEFRVLCQGEMVPLPSDIVNFLEYRA